jgi:nucleotide-binding universal stress UspA family protein
MLLGGVSTAMLHDAPCAVLLARPPRYGRFPTRILVGVDGSPASMEAARVAESVADRFGSELIFAAATGGKEIDLEPIHALTPHFIRHPWRPVDALVDLADAYDLLVVGSRGLHGLASLGSVSERVAHRARSSVLVVRSAHEGGST